mgnify:FL=1
MFNNFLLLYKSIKKRGFIDTLQFVLYEYIFDIVHKTNTRGYLELGNMNIKDNIQNSTNYRGSNYFLLKKFFNKYDVEGKELIDFGSGKGRVLLMAMKYKAKKAIGVEFAKELINISEMNLATYKINNNLTTEYELIFDDVLNYEIPESSNVLFFYNPFNELILNELILKIKELKQDFLIVYINPVHRSIFDKSFIEIDNFNDELLIYKGIKK